MNIKDVIYQKQTAALSNEILSVVLKDRLKLEELMEYFFSNDLRVCQAASWVVGKIAQHEQHLLDDYMPKMLEQLSEPKHDAFIRNTIRSWQFMDFDEDLEGEVFERCFSYIGDPKKAIAIRAFSMTVCFNIAKKYPEILEELKEQLELCQLEDGKGILSRSRNILKEIDQIQKQ